MSTSFLEALPGNLISKDTHLVFSIYNTMVNLSFDIYVLPVPWDGLRRLIMVFHDKV